MANQGAKKQKQKNDAILAKTRYITLVVLVQEADSTLPKLLGTAHCLPDSVALCFLFRAELARLCILYCGASDLPRWNHKSRKAILR